MLETFAGLAIEYPPTIPVRFVYFWWCKRLKADSQCIICHHLNLYESYIYVNWAYRCSILSQIQCTNLLYYFTALLKEFIALLGICSWNWNWLFRICCFYWLSAWNICIYKWHICIMCTGYQVEKCCMGTLREETTLLEVLLDTAISSPLSLYQWIQLFAIICYAQAHCHYHGLPSISRYQNVKTGPQNAGR